MNKQSCLTCRRADMRQAAKNGMPGFLLCTDEPWFYGTQRSICGNGKYTAAANEQIAARIAWYARHV
ncbi:hypothetical protein [Stenoxybacter acetivorans]|uniref:hypothetical protein n=1 Tax=Stenoxybacter acetivorans TaxID=422441 RepID=UPI00055B6AA7|nr:hypothetical protein [Stenoxybacter acetivorans]